MPLVIKVFWDCSSVLAIQWNVRVFDKCVAGRRPFHFLVTADASKINRKNNGLVLVDV